ncbi:unnamed protein product [Prorocentrum cordatum]|uniref:Helicase ATP-binding domain-containing protein n=1 Tax=Prorocentrum cordatum TaxID=2364126 RepID=A0ABN9VXP3_9DINO|nr:unnamed protein product [Polarella glacialis]
MLKTRQARLRKGVAVLCATPGRLAYHLEHTSALGTDGLRSLVLDEADRLLDMGFEPQIRAIHRAVVGERRGSVQTLLVSATLSPAVRRLAEWLLRWLYQSFQEFTLTVQDATEDAVQCCIQLQDSFQAAQATSANMPFFGHELHGVAGRGPSTWSGVIG